MYSAWSLTWKYEKKKKKRLHESGLKRDFVSSWILTSPLKRRSFSHQAFPLSGLPLYIYSGFPLYIFVCSIVYIGTSDERPAGVIHAYWFCKTIYWPHQSTDNWLIQPSNVASLPSFAYPVISDLINYALPDQASGSIQLKPALYDSVKFPVLKGEDSTPTTAYIIIPPPIPLNLVITSYQFWRLVIGEFVWVVHFALPPGQRPVHMQC